MSDTPKVSSNSRDFQVAILLAFTASIFTLPLLDCLEFFRHTEADRTLIGWEMLQRRDFVIPHLLGDVYATKPPLFYALLALVFSIVGSPSEAAARSVSAASSILLVAAHFLFLRRAGWAKGKALLSSAILLSGFQFLTASLSAEIDMTFCFLSSISLYFGFLSFRQLNSGRATTLAYLFMALAFLTKGPQIFVFYAFAVGGFLLCNLSASKDWLADLLHFMKSQIIGVLILVTLIAVWLYLLSRHLSASDLAFHIKNEILDRFVSDPRENDRARGIFFYALTIFAGFLPWSLALPSLRLKPAMQEKEKSLLTYCFCLVIPSFILFSLASGKSGRYLFPIYPFIACIMTEAAWRLASLPQPRVIRWVAYFLSLLGIAAGVLLLPIASRFSSNIEPWRIIVSSAAILAAFAWLLLEVRKAQKLGPNIYLPLVVSLLMLRIPYGLVYAKVRNEVMSVKKLSQAINFEIPASSPLYILESFDRWIPYYLIREGRTVLRLTPAIAQDLHDSASSKAIFILINADNEAFRLQQIAAIEPEARVIRTFKGPKRDYHLISLPGSSAIGFNPQRVFPTNISPVQK